MTLPQWTKDAGVYACDDPHATMDAGACLLMHGFDLPAFDMWLSALEPCGARRELLERREQAIQATYANKTDAARRHLEWMLLRARAIQRDDFLLPLARRDAQHSADVRKGADERLRRDPVQAAKAEAFKLWKDRHAGKYPDLRTNDQFAIECMRRWAVLKHSTILGWCTEWNKRAKG